MAGLHELNHFCCYNRETVSRRQHEQNVVMPPAKRVLLEDVWVVLPESATSPPTPEFSDSPETSKSSPAVSVEEPVQASPQKSHPVQKRAIPGYLKGYVCKFESF